VLELRYFGQQDYPFFPSYKRGCHGCDRLVVELQLPMQTVPITTNVVSLNLAETRCTQYNSDLLQVGGFLQVLQFPPPIKLTVTITEILLKVALNTITPYKFTIFSPQMQ
jgi:hypothetical protein